MKNLYLFFGFYLLANMPFCSAQIPQNGLKAHFQFNSTTYDTTGNNPNAILATSQISYYNLGISGQALELSPGGASVFNSTNPAVEFVQGGSNNMNTIIEANNDFTISFWFKSRTSNQFSLIGKRATCSTNSAYLEIRSEGNSANTSRIMAEMREGAIINSSSGPNANEYVSDCWTHQVCSREVLASGGCVIKFYINGLLSKLDTFPQVIQIAPTTANNRLTLAGSPCIGVDGTIPLDGYFDEFMVYDRAVDATEVLDIYNYFFNQAHISLSPQGCILVPTEKVQSAGNAKEVNFTVYPNPTTSSITIEFNKLLEDNTTFITLYNLQGKVVLNATFPTGAQKRSLLLEQLSKGIYLVVLSDKKGLIATQKVALH